jgi:8-oxo-dGTP diphosphatase
MIRRSEKEEHAPGMIALPGGKTEVEGNTTDILERTVRREIEEETGVIVSDNMRYIHNTSFVTAAGIHVINIVFLCRYESGEAKVIDSYEAAEVMWMTTEDILSDSAIEIWPKNSIHLAERTLESCKEGSF